MSEIKALVEKFQKDRDLEAFLQSLQACPITLLFGQVNYRCNLQCKHCSVNHFPTSMDETVLPAKMWAPIMTDIMNRFGGRIVVIAAMEPLLDTASRSACWQILNTAQNADKKIGLITNGTHFPEFYHEWQAKYADLQLDYIDFSVEGTRRLNDFVRGVGHFDRLNSQEFQQLVPGGDFTKSIFTSTTINAYTTPQDLFDLIDFLHNHTHIRSHAFLLMVPDSHIQSEMWLKNGTDWYRQLTETLQIVAESSDSVILEHYISTPDLRELVRTGLIPNWKDLIEDLNSSWYLRQGNIWIRFQNPLINSAIVGFFMPDGTMRHCGFRYYPMNKKFDMAWYDYDKPKQKYIRPIIPFQIDERCFDQECFRLCLGQNQQCTFLQRS